MSPWGFVIVAVLLLGALYVVWLIDRRLLFRALRVSPLGRIPRLPAPLWMSAVVSILAVSCAMSGCLLLCLPGGSFFPVLAVVLVCQLLAVPRSLAVYHRSLLHTRGHRLYLLAGGATHLESVIPSVRRCLRSALTAVLWTRTSPLLFGMLLLLFGLLLAGASLAAALITVLVLWAAAIAASLLSSMLSMWLADRWLFNSQQQLTSAAAGKPSAPQSSSASERSASRPS